MNKWIMVLIILGLLGCSIPHQYECDTDMDCYVECIENGDTKCE